MEPCEEFPRGSLLEVLNVQYTLLLVPSWLSYSVCLVASHTGCCHWEWHILESTSSCKGWVSTQVNPSATCRLLIFSSCLEQALPPIANAFSTHSTLPWSPAALLKALSGVFWLLWFLFWGQLTVPSLLLLAQQYFQRLWWMSCTHWLQNSKRIWEPPEQRSYDLSFTTWQGKTSKSCNDWCSWGPPAILTRWSCPRPHAYGSSEQFLPGNGSFRMHDPLLFHSALIKQ